jgi:hypothetical protein
METSFVPAHASGRPPAMPRICTWLTGLCEETERRLWD